MAIDLPEIGNKHIKITNKFILDNLASLNGNMDMITGRVVDPLLVKHWRSYTQQNLKPYPPVPPMSTYQRTRELYRGWDVNSDRRNAAVWTGVSDTVDYADKVIGDEEDQQWFHILAGWIRLSKHEAPLLKSSIPISTRGYESEISRFLFKKGIK